MMMRLPRAASATLTFPGETGQASPNSSDSVNVASGRVAPASIGMGLLLCLLEHITPACPHLPAADHQRAGVACTPQPVRGPLPLCRPPPVPWPLLDPASGGANWA